MEDSVNPDQTGQEQAALDLHYFIQAYMSQYSR